MIKLVCDSSGDLHTLPGCQFVSVPMNISTAKAGFRDDDALNIPEMLQHLAGWNDRSFTACPSVHDWIEAFGGADTVYVGTITSGLSGSYNSAMAAKELYLQDHPQAKVHVFDSLSTGPEVRMIMEKLAELTLAGMDFSSVVEKVQDYQKHLRLFFSLQRLHNLAQNGRVSKVAAAAAGVLGIRVIGTASEVGTLQPLAKCRGDKKALAEILKDITEAGYNGGRMRISHVVNPELAQTFCEMVKARWPGVDVVIAQCRGLCSYYAEQGGLLVAVETC